MWKMDDSCANAQKDDQGKDSLYSLSKDMKLAIKSSSNCPEHKSKWMVSLTKPKHLLKLNVKQLQTSEWCIEELFLRNTRGVNNMIPKHIVSLDEKYLRHCLEMIHISAAKAATCSISVNVNSLSMGISSESCTSPNIRRTNIFESSRCAIECPLVVGTGNVVGSPVGHWIIGSITGNRSMVNILKSPLFRQLGASENDVDFGKSSLIGVQGSLCSDPMSSPGGLTVCSLEKKQEKYSMISENYNHGLDAVHNRINSISSSNKSCSDQTSSSTSATLSHGMLQCTWNRGIPHFVFSVDDRREIYVANLLKAESSDDKALDHMYLFHSGMRGQKEHEMPNNESNLIGKMKISISFTLCPNNSRVTETEFVLFGNHENHTGEMQTSSQHFRKNEALSKKVAKVFKSSLAPKQRSNSKFGRTSTIPDYCPWEPRHETCGASDRSSLIDDCLLPNIELTAIVIKEHLHVNHQEAEVGGWGLNFLKKDGLKQTSPSRNAPVPSEFCLRNTGECSTSMDIIVPAGIHGGPRNRNGGPSSLTERWRSGGHCDCGGWDIGCPLTVLNTRSCKEEVLLQADKHGNCKSFDLFIQGIERGAPTMKMVNIHDDLYFIHFQSSLSALQSFSVAVAIIHTQSPQLQPKNV